MAALASGALRSDLREAKLQRHAAEPSAAAGIARLRDATRGLCADPLVGDFGGLLSSRRVGAHHRDLFLLGCAQSGSGIKGMSKSNLCSFAMKRYVDKRRWLNLWTLL